VVEISSPANSVNDKNIPVRTFYSDNRNNTLARVLTKNAPKHDWQGISTSA